MVQCPVGSEQKGQRFLKSTIYLKPYGSSRVIDRTEKPTELMKGDELKSKEELKKKEYVLDKRMKPKMATGEKGIVFVSNNFCLFLSLLYPR